MVSARRARCVATPLATLGAGRCWYPPEMATLATSRGRRPRGEVERSLASCADRFELEWRERALMRWQSSDGSLLG